MPLGTPESLKGTAKLAGTVALLTMAVKWAKDKKYLPVDPFKCAQIYKTMSLITPANTLFADLGFWVVFN